MIVLFIFELTPHAFPTDRSKVAFIISHLTGRAKAWDSAEWGRGFPLYSSLTDFQAALTRTFDPVKTDREKAQELTGLRQGKGSVCDYAIRFCTLAAVSGWNSTALYDVFLKGLAALTNTELADSLPFAAGAVPSLSHRGRRRAHAAG